MIDVTAAIIQREGLILAARRKQGSHMAGYWEFPGGKIEPGETPEECLQRELKEELSIESKIGPFFEESCYDYGTKQIRLLSYFVDYKDSGKMTRKIMTYKERIHHAKPHIR